MVHQGQGLPLRLEAGDDLPRVHAQLDDLQGHPAADRLLLLGHVDDRHAAFADLLEELVPADHGAGAFDDPGDFDRQLQRIGRLLDEAVLAGVDSQEGFQAGQQGGIAAAGLPQVRKLLVGLVDGQRRTEDGLFVYDTFVTHTPNPCLSKYNAPSAARLPHVKGKNVTRLLIFDV